MINDVGFDQMLGSALRRDAEAGFPISASVLPAVKARLEQRAGGRGRRTVTALVLVGGVIALSTATGVAVSSSNSPIHISWVKVPVSGPGKPIEMTMEKPFETTVADAQARLGFHVLTLDGWPAARTPVKLLDGRTQSVVFHPSVTAIDGRPIKHSTGAVSLYYSVGDVRVEIVEQLDANGAGPMDVRLKQPDGPVPSMLKAAVETIDGAEYLVFRSPNDNRIQRVQWKTQEGVLIFMNISTSLDKATVSQIIKHLQ